MDPALVRLEDDGTVARIVLSRPPLNVLNLEMVGQLDRALAALAERPALRAVVISAEGRAFSAGVAIEDHLPDKVGAMLPAFHRVFKRLHGLKAATITAV